MVIRLKILSNLNFKIVGRLVRTISKIGGDSMQFFIRELGIVSM